MSCVAPVVETTLADLKLVRRGKVRDVYAVDEARLLIVATDRISAFDSVSPTPIERKGEVLTALSRFWFAKLGHIVPNHLLTTNIDEMPDVVRGHANELRGRTMLVRHTEVFPVECVVRGYLSGSGWKEYKQSQSICGINLPKGLKESDKLPEPIFTPATKEDEGHDINVNESFMANKIGRELTTQLKEYSIAIYRKANDYAEKHGIIIADTKFEFGLYKDKVILIDEVLTPDSSRFWPKDRYKPGQGQPSFDKQYVRDYLETLDWDKTPPGPQLPAKIIEETSQKYLEICDLLLKY